MMNALYWGGFSVSIAKSVFVPPVSLKGENLAHNVCGLAANVQTEVVEGLKVGLNIANN